MDKFTAFIKKKKWWFIVGAAVVVVLLFFAFRNGNDGFKTVDVQRGTVVSEVSVTGQVKPSQKIDLAFEGGGRIAAIDVKVGDRVIQGQRLAALESADLYAQLSQAQATLKAQQAKLEELKKGARPEDIATKEAELKKAEADLASYYVDIVNVVNDAYAKADDAVRKQLDDFFTNDDINPQLTFSSTNSQAANDARTKRFLSGTKLTEWRKALDTLDTTLPPSSLEVALVDAQGRLSVIRDFLNTAAQALDGSIDLSASALTTLKTNINTARTNVNTAASNVTTQDQLIAAQILTIARIQSELDLKRAGATAEQLIAQEALAEQAQGQIEYYQSQIAKNVLRTPFAGVVTKVSFEVGEIVAAKTAVISIVGAGFYEIEANVAESDIAKIKIGNTARVTLDAYGSDIEFDASVVSIDLSETIVEGVATYKTRLQFAKEDTRILPGLTANVDILSDRKENVLFVPTRNVITKNGHRYMKVLSGDGTVSEVEIVTGLRGSDGRTEIVRGVLEGAKIVVE